jgi:hypothetical protein
LEETTTEALQGEGEAAEGGTEKETLEDNRYRFYPRGASQIAFSGGSLSNLHPSLQ